MFRHSTSLSAEYVQMTTSHNPKRIVELLPGLAGASVPAVVVVAGMRFCLG